MMCKSVVKYQAFCLMRSSRPLMPLISNQARHSKSSGSAEDRGSRIESRTAFLTTGRGARFATQNFPENESLPVMQNAYQSKTMNLSALVYES